MHSLFRLSGLLILGLALIVPSFAGDGKDKKAPKKGAAVEKKDDDDLTAEKPAAKDTKKDAKKDTKKKAAKKAKAEPKPKFPYNHNYYFDGKLTQLEGNSKDFTLQVKVPEPNPDGLNRMAQLELQLFQQQQQFAQAQNFQGRQSALNAIQQTQLQMVQAQGNLIRLADRDVKMRAAENVRVRWANPPPDYDDKGRLKKYTEAEKKALRGDEGLPGYKGEYDALQRDQYVRVYLPKQPPAQLRKNYAKNYATKLKGMKGKKRVAPTEDDELRLRDRLEAVVIVILSEPKR
jgi:hypothetical protein